MSQTIVIQKTFAGFWGSVWLLSNISYAGMRAQNKPENGTKRTVAFICGFPHTVVSLLAVDEGSERVYGVDCPNNPHSPLGLSLVDVLVKPIDYTNITKQITI